MSFVHEAGEHMRFGGPLHRRTKVIFYVKEEGEKTEEREYGNNNRNRYILKKPNSARHNHDTARRGIV